MLLADVNIFIYANRQESMEHRRYRTWLQDRLGGLEPFGVSELVLSAFIRITTNPRVYRVPSTVAEALEFCHVALAAPAAVPIRPGPRHWLIFRDLCIRGQARGNLIPDAYLAALALEHGATLATTDRGLHRYPGVRIEHPLGT